MEDWDFLKVLKDLAAGGALAIKAMEFIRKRAKGSPPVDEPPVDEPPEPGSPAVPPRNKGFVRNHVRATSIVPASYTTFDGGFVFLRSLNDQRSWLAFARPGRGQEIAELAGWKSGFFSAKTKRAVVYHLHAAYTAYYVANPPTGEPPP